MSPSKNLLRHAAPVTSRLSALIKPLVFVFLLGAVTNASANAGETIPAATHDPSLRWTTSVVKSGDTLSSIADKHRIPASELHRIVNCDLSAQQLARIKPGEKIRFAFDTDNSVQRVSKRINEETQLLILRANGSFIARTINKPLERRIQYATGTIIHSLFGAANAAGISSSVVMDFAGLFGWDIDFSLDVRSGDQFSVVYESLYRNGEFVRDGHIIAAEYINRGDSFRAVRYTDPDGRSDYYSPEGTTLRKAFLRSPVNFARVSSGFSLKRKHPILHTIRAHKGVDYAAKTGTPIRATGDGKVIHRGRKGGYGRTIVIQHGSRYSTLYAHMSKYAGKAHVGSRVKQGQIIGYVGRSGMATGSHLHYEFRADGVHRNPLRFKFPGVAPVPKKYRNDFLAQTAALTAQLDVLVRNQLASIQQ